MTWKFKGDLPHDVAEENGSFKSTTLEQTCGKWGRLAHRDMTIGRRGSRPEASYWSWR
jgi:hypothetical protein